MLLQLEFTQPTITEVWPHLHNAAPARVYTTHHSLSLFCTLVDTTLDDSWCFYFQSSISCGVPYGSRGCSPVFSITWLRKRSLCPPLAFFPWTLPARMRSSSSPFRMMWPVKRVCLSLMVLRSWRSCPIRWSTEMLVSCAVYETRSIRR